MSYEHRGVQAVTHGGASTGYGSSIMMIPEARVAVIVLTNKSGETLARTREKALELMMPLKARVREERKPIPAPGELEMSKYVGVYSHAPLTWEVFIRAGKLFLRSDGSESELTPMGGDTFVYGPSSSGQVVFVAGMDGNAEHLFTGLYAARRKPATR